MHTDPFSRFIKFVECRRLLALAEKEKEKEKACLDDLNKALDDGQKHIDTLKAAALSMRTKVHAYELESKAHREREKELTHRLEVTTSPKEYKSYKHELEEVSRLYASCEEQLFEAWQAHESAKSDYEKRHAEFQNWMVHQHDRMHEQEQKILSHETREAELIKQCQEYEKNVTQDMLTQYHRLGEHLIDPVVPVHEGYCSACHFHVSQSSLEQLRHHVLVSCSNCYRMLYLSQV